MLYTWFLLTAILLFALLIARYYQYHSRIPTHFQLFIVPVVLFGFVAVRYANIRQVAGDPIADIASAVGGVFLSGLCLVLYRRMLHSTGDH